MAKLRYYIDWLFRDQTERKGKYVFAEHPNLPLIVFMVCIVLSVVVYPGFFQSLFAATAYLALVYWSILEVHSGRSRFRRLLGYLGVLAVIGALWLRLGF